MFSLEFLELTYATPDDLKYVMDNKEPGAGLVNPSKGTRKGDMFCLKYKGEPVAVCGMRINSVYSYMGWGWCVVVKDLPIPSGVLAKVSLAMCESYSERVEILVATVVKGNSRTNRFAEWLGFEIDKDLTNKYNLKRAEIMRYTGDRRRKA